jgi:hypothetical protein
MSSRRHEQAEREMIAREVSDFVKVMASGGGIYLAFIGPWQLFKTHNHPWGLAVLAVFANLIGALIVLAIVATKVSESRKKNTGRNKIKTRASATAPPATTSAAHAAALKFESWARSVAASDIGLHEIPDVLLRSRVKEIRDGRL